VRESVKRSEKTGKILVTLILGGCAIILVPTAVSDAGFGREDPVFSTTISCIGVLASSNAVSGLSICGATDSATVNSRQTTANKFDIARRKNIEVSTSGCFETMKRESRYCQGGDSAFGKPEFSTLGV